MVQTTLLAFAAGVLGTNAVPHFVKGMVGEEFPNVLGNGPLPNAVAGALGIVQAVLLGYWANLPAHPWAGFAAAVAGALLLAVFHGSRGAFRVNRRLGKPNPIAVHG